MLFSCRTGRGRLLISQAQREGMMMGAANFISLSCLRSEELGDIL